EGWYKRPVDCELNRPKFSILNPELTFSLPPYQTACGVADIMSHVMERYFTPTREVDFTDHLCEATLKAVIKNAPRVLEHPSDYDARAQIMWASTVAHNDVLSTGRAPDWGTHNIEHEISAIYDVPHGAGLAVVFPAWMSYVYKEDLGRFVRFALKVWNVEMDVDDQERTARAGIRRCREFFRSIGLPVTLEQLEIPSERLEEMAGKAVQFGPLGQFRKLEKGDVLEILNLAR
ncbi:MAG: iron-containing alcohol dehydrogenase, partial [Spirochaetota bacterium]